MVVDWGVSQSQQVHTSGMPPAPAGLTMHLLHGMWVRMYLEIVAIIIGHGMGNILGS